METYKKVLKKTQSILYISAIAIVSTVILAVLTPVMLVGAILNAFGEDDSIA